MDLDFAIISSEDKKVAIVDFKESIDMVDGEYLLIDFTKDGVARIQLLEDAEE